MTKKRLAEQLMETYPALTRAQVRRLLAVSTDAVLLGYACEMLIVGCSLSHVLELLKRGEVFKS